LVRTDLILDPGQYAEAPPYQLLEAAARGFVAVDHRFLHAILDHPERSLGDLVRFGCEDRPDDPIDLEGVLLDVFRYLRTPEAIPYFIKLVRRNPSDVSDEVVEGLAALGAPAVDPLLDLFREIEDGEAGDVAFLLASLRTRDARVLEALTHWLDADVCEAAICLEIHGDPAAVPALQAALAKLPPEDLRNREFVESAIEVLSPGIDWSGYAPDPFDIWPQYAEEDSPEFEVLSEEDRLAVLECGSATLRAQVAASYSNELPLETRARLLEHAKADPDMTVRRACWETLGEISDEPEVRRAMLAVIGDPASSLEEKAGATIGLARQSDNAIVFQAIEDLYQDERGRASSLKAMARSFDRRFAAYPPKHLDDPDPEIKSQAIWATGYLNLSSEAPRLEAFFHDPRHRTPALFAYALAIPGETSRGRANALLKKIEDSAGGLDADEEELVRLALDQRLMLRGHKPVFFTDEASEEDEMEPATSANVGRNDPCPCGSGKKYKKCCGA
jgi:SEC-C motif-containing protein/PBS lyase HEAT-like repeat-containing protein